MSFTMMAGVTDPLAYRWQNYSEGRGKPLQLGANTLRMNNAILRESGIY